MEAGLGPQGAEVLEDDTGEVGARLWGGAQAKHTGPKLGCGAASPELGKSKAVTDGCQVWGESRCGENRLGEMLGRWGSARWLPALSGGR